MAQKSIRIKEQVVAAWKRLLSFRKQTWELRDYPIVVRCQNATSDLADTPTRFEPYKYVARIVTWPLAGGGETPEDAMRELGVNFEKAATGKRHKGMPLPRPGTAVPVEFAQQEQVNSHGELVNDVVRRVLGLDWAWISDESSLWDFHTNDTNDDLHAKISEVYGVDTSDIESGNLAEIVDRISATRS
jgi:hypothetical protein